MEIHVQKETDLSLHQQIVTQVSMQIAAGIVKPGTKLPSIRALSRKLGIHHNTCLAAYRELAEVGLIELKQGSGAHVRELDTDKRQSPLLTDTDLSTLADFMAREAKRLGYRLDAMQLALSEAYGKLLQSDAGRQLVFVDLHPDILPVFKAELEQALQQPVQTVLLSELPQAVDSNACFIVSRYHYQTLKEKLSAAGKGMERLTDRIIVIDVGSGQQELGLIRQLSSGTLIGIVSVSSIILRQAEAVIRAVCGEEILIRSILFGEEPVREVEQLAQRAKVIFSDQCCLSTLQSLTTRPVQRIQAIPDHELTRLMTLTG